MERAGRVAAVTPQQVVNLPPIVAVVVANRVAVPKALGCVASQQGNQLKQNAARRGCACRIHLAGASRGVNAHLVDWNADGQACRNVASLMNANAMHGGAWLRHESGP